MPDEVIAQIIEIVRRVAGIDPVFHESIRAQAGSAGGRAWGLTKDGFAQSSYDFVDDVIAIALNYGSRREIARAARELAERVSAGELDPEAIDEARFERALNPLDAPDPDLLIRTSGEQRLSNFMLWQLAYTELVFLTVNWPEFDKSHLDKAIAEFQRRERRYGASSG